MSIFLAGGGAITHCAMLSDKWDSFLYNDLNPMITGLFLDAINGKYHDERRIITREEFNELKETDAFVRYIWSFGNGGTAYLWGRDLEDIKCQACRIIVENDIHESRLAYRKFIKLIEDNMPAALDRVQAYCLR